MFNLKPSDPDGANYEHDLALWYARQLALLRAQRFDQLDLDNLIEELDGMVRNLRRELASRLEVLLMHLLKCQYQRQRISRGWLGTLAEQRSEIEKLLQENPSFGPTVMQVADKVYPSAARRAALETGLPRTGLPKANPYTREQLFDFDYTGD